jgi:scyllo-inositol 2-dehydrogenase (NADP+)
MQPINTAILSFGMSGQVFHGPFIDLHPGFNFYAVWERTKNLAQEKYPGVKTYRDLDELLRDDAIELVIVNTPTYTHYEYAKKALEANKHAIVEKAFTTTFAEAEELATLAKQKGKFLSVYQNRRWDSDFKTVKKIFDEDLLGDVVEAEIHFDRFNQNLSPKAHKEIPNPGAGVVYDLGPHVIDQALTLFGMPEAVFADIRVLRPHSQVDDYFEILLYYPGVRVRLHSSYIVREPIPSFVLHGTKGSFHKSRADVQEAALLAGKKPGTPEWGKEPESEKGLLHTEKDGQVTRDTVPTLQGNYMDYFEGIHQALRNNKPLPVTAEDGANVMRIIETALASRKEGRVIRF